MPENERSRPRAEGDPDDYTDDAILTEGCDMEPRVVPPPTNPMGVVRDFVADLYTGAEGDLLLHAHCSDLYAWNEKCWPEVELRAVKKSLYSWLEHALYEKIVKDEIELVSWDPTRRKVDDVVDALRAVVHLDGALEPPAWLVGADEKVPAAEIVPMNNGLLHVPSRTILSHTPRYWSHHSLPFDYDPSAPYPSRWLQFLKELWGDDLESISTLQEMIGYLVAGDTSQQKICLLVGPKRSGKGTIGRILTGLLGKHNVGAPTLAGLSTNFGLQVLIDKPLALVSDARLSGRADAGIVVERLLSISGEDSLTVDRKFKDPWTGRLPSRFLILTNELPRLTDSSGALSSRFVMLVLTRSFLGRENPALTTELLEEATGILNWSLEGLDRLSERGYFVQPQSGAEAIQQMEDLASPVSTFMRERCLVEPQATVGVETLWDEWKSWCEDEGRGAGTKAVFGRDLKAAAPLIRKTRPRKEEGSRLHEYEGIRLLGANEVNPDAGEKQSRIAMTAMTTTPDGHGGHGGHGGHSNNVMYHSWEEQADAVALQSPALEVGKSYRLTYCHPFTDKVEDMSGVVKNLDPGLVRLQEPGGRYHYLKPSRIENVVAS